MKNYLIEFTFDELNSLLMSLYKEEDKYKELIKKIRKSFRKMEPFNITIS
jgi:hypothetical protein